MPKIQDISRSKLIWGLKFLVIGLGLWYITSYFRSVPVDDIQVFDWFGPQNSIFLILVLIIFSALNWFGEIKKWQHLVGDISVDLSAKQTIIAHSLSIFTPQKLGEFGGKCLFYSKAERYKIISLTAVGHLTQLMATLIFGMLGIIILFTEINIFQFLSLQWSWSLLTLPALLLVKPIRIKLKKIFTEIKYIERQKFINAFCWSVFRYLFFAHQFYLLLKLFEIEIPYLQGLCAISLVYFVASVLPVFAIADALVKGSIALSIFKLIGYGEPSILAIVFLMWISNVMLPAAIGYIWMLKWRPKLLMSEI
jgi:uncharacterized membrane protein YbhN (UPF0104 family)